jgi:hypothetical protein
LNADDVIDGGGSTDKLVVDLFTSFGGFNNDGGMTNVGHILLNNGDDGDYTFSVANMEGVSDYELNAGEGTLSLEDLDQTGIWVFTNQTVGTMSLDFAEEALEADENYLDLELNAVGAEADPLAVDVTYTADETGITNLNVHAWGFQDNYVDFSGIADVEYLTINGDGVLDIAGVGDELTHFDAQNFHNDTLTADLTGAELESVLGSNGDTTITVDDFTEDVVLHGGGGENKLIIETYAGTLRPDMMDFQTLEIEELTDDFTLREGDSPILNLFDLILGEDTFDSLAHVRDIGLEDFTVTLTGEQTSNTDADRVRYDGTGDFGLVVDGEGEAADDDSVTNKREVRASEADGQATVTVTGYAAYDGYVDVRTASSLDLVVDENLGDDEANHTIFSGEIRADNAEIVNVTADGEIDGAVIDAGMAGTANFTIGENSASLHADSDLDLVHTLNVDAASAFGFDNSFDNARNITVTGILTEDGDQVVFTSLGAATLDSDMLINAATFEGDLNLGDVTVDDTKAIQVQAAGLEGMLTFGDIAGGDLDVQVAGNENAVEFSGTIEMDGSVQVNADGMLGDLSFQDTVTAGDTIQILAQGNEGVVDATGAAFTAETIVINADASEGNITLDDLTATDVAFSANNTWGANITLGDVGDADAAGDVVLQLNGSESIVQVGAIHAEALSILGNIEDTFTVTDLITADEVGITLASMNTGGAVTLDGIAAGDGDVALDFTGSEGTVTVTNDITAQEIGFVGGDAVDTVSVIGGVDKDDDDDLTYDGARLTIDMGEGGDTLTINEDGTDGFEAFESSVLDGGAGTDTLEIAASTADFTSDDTTISNFENIDLDGNTLILTAAQVDSLGEVDYNPEGSGGTLNLEDLGADEVDLSNVAAAVAGTATLAADDVTLDADTDLGGFDVELGDGQELTGTDAQIGDLTITEAEANGTLNVTEIATGVDLTNATVTNLNATVVANTTLDGAADLNGADVDIQGDFILTGTGAQLDGLTIVDADGADTANVTATAVDGESLIGVDIAGTLTIGLAADGEVDLTGAAMGATINGGADVNTIVGSGFDDVITGGAGADELTGGAGADTFAGLELADQSIIASETSFAGGTIAADDTWTFATGSAGSVDTITDFTSGTDMLKGTANDTAPTTLIGEDQTVGLADGTAYVVYGSYDATTGIFTAAAAYAETTAEDALVVEGDGTQTATNEEDFIVLTGLNQALIADDFTNA